VRSLGRGDHLGLIELASEIYKYKRKENSYLEYNPHGLGNSCQAPISIESSLYIDMQAFD
jgi:hypothetical protein